MCANIFAGKILKVRLMSQGVNILIILIENAKLAYIGVYHFVFLPTLYEKAYFPTTSSNQVYFGYEQICYMKNRYIIATIICTLLIINEVECSFMCLKAICVFFFFSWRHIFSVGLFVSP